jgi:hypothetical protein
VLLKEAPDDHFPVRLDVSKVCDTSLQVAESLFKKPAALHDLLEDCLQQAQLQIWEGHPLQVGPSSMLLHPLWLPTAHFVGHMTLTSASTACSVWCVLWLCHVSLPGDMHCCSMLPAAPPP